MDLRQGLRTFKVILGARPQERAKIFSLLKLFERADRETARFRARSKLQCVGGCGRCCENPHVETTVLEMMPLAIHLWQQGQADIWLDRSLEKSSQGTCIFFEPNPLVKGNGRCSVYPFRPLVCRLFGFAASDNKYQKPQLVTCQTIKQVQAQEYARAVTSVEAGEAVPKIRDFSLAASALDPELSRELLPINEAVKVVIEKIGILRKIRTQVKNG